MGSNISFILLNKNPGTIAIGGHTSTPPLGTLFWWSIPAWNPNPTPGYSVTTKPLNYTQSVSVPLTANDLMNLTNNQIPQITSNNAVYYQLVFPSQNLKVLPPPAPGTTPMIPPGWSLLAIPTSYIVSNSSSSVTINIPSSYIMPATVSVPVSVPVPENIAGATQMALSTWNNWTPYQNTVQAPVNPNYTMVSGALSTPSYGGVATNIAPSPTPTSAPGTSLTVTPDKSIFHFYICLNNAQIKQTGTTQSGSPIYQINTLQSLTPE